jgi:hypothetical protein
MTKKPEPKPDNPEQSKRFIDTAKEIQTDEDPEAFDRAFEKVGRSKPQPKTNEK